MPVEAKITVGGEFTPFRQDATRAITDFEKEANRAFGRLGSSGLGQISRDFNQFEKSLIASNARVIAFGLSAGSIFAVTSAFRNMVRETINVEKSFTDINVILNLSRGNLTRFGNDLFNVAKNTGQSFNTVAEAAKELARQGNNASEIIVKARDALILVRQSGLTAEQAVRSITTATNSFNRQLLDSTQIINKLTNLDIAFAVSTKDLAEGLSRTGSAASDAKVSFEELLALITSARQITGRTGGVIAQALNTVFARVARPEVIEQLRELGVQINNTQTGIEKLKALSAGLQNASADQASLIREAAGGVRNLNVLSAVLTDLTGKYSIYGRAVKEASNENNSALERNAKQNETLAALGNKALVNLTQFSSQVGKLTLGPAVSNILKGANFLLESSFGKQGEDAGNVLGQGLAKGIGEFIGGPGLALIGITIAKLFSRLAIESGTALKVVLGINKEANQRASIEEEINNILKNQVNVQSLLLKGDEGRRIAIEQVNAALLEQQRLIAFKAGIVSEVAAVQLGRGKGKAVGLIPEAQERVGAYAGGYTPGQVRELNVPQLGPVVYNTAEKIKYFPGLSQPAIIPPKQSLAGQNYQNNFIKAHGFNPYANGGLIPNYAFSPVQREHALWGYNALESIYQKPGGKGFKIVVTPDNHAPLLNSLSSFGKGGGKFEDFIPQIKEDLTKAGIDYKKIIYWPDNEDNRGKARTRLFEGLKDKYFASGSIPNFAGGERYMGASNIKINPRAILEELSRDERRVLIKIMEGATVPEIASEMGLDINGAGILLENAKKSYATKYNLAKQGRLASGGAIPNYAKFQPNITLGKLLGQGSFKSIYGISSIQPDLFDSRYNLNPSELVAGILHRKNIKDFEKQEQLFKYGAPVPQIFGYEDVLEPYKNRKPVKRNAALIEKIHPFSDDAIGDILYSLGVNKWAGAQIPLNIAGILSNYLKEKGYIDSYRTTYRKIPGDLALRNLGVKQGFSSGQALSELATIAQLDPSSKLGRGDINYIDAIFRNRGLTIADVGYLNPRKSGGLVPNFNALSSAISRENAAGIPFSNIRVGSSPQISSNLNPLGLGVYNTRDEPLGLNQGISRVASMGLDPKRAGIPNFAEPFSTRQAISDNDRARLNQTAAQIAKDYVNGAASYKETIKAVKNAGEEFKLSAKGLQQLREVVTSSKSKISSFFEETKKSSQVYNYFGQPTSKPATFDYRSLIPGSFFGAKSETPFQFLNRNLLPGFKQPLLLGYNPPISNHLGNQPFLPGLSYENIRDEQGQLNLYRARALELQQEAQREQARLFELGNPIPQIVPSLRQRIGSRLSNLSQRANNIITSPRGQNFALAGSFLLPTVAGAVGEGIGDQTTTQRGFGRLVQGGANIGSYSLLGAQFGGLPGGLIGAGLGSIIETPKIISAFTDKIPDLEREVERLTEKISQVNDGFSNIIQTNEKLSQYQKGELNLTPVQYGNLKLGQQNQISQLGALFPQYSSKIRAAASSGDINEIEKVVSEIIPQATSENNQKQIEILREKLFPSSPVEAFSKGTGKFFSNLGSVLAKSAYDFEVNAPISPYSYIVNKDIKLKSREDLSNAASSFFGRGQNKSVLNPVEQSDIEELTRATLLQTSTNKNFEGQNLQNILIDRYRKGGRNNTYDIDTLQDAIDNLRKEDNAKNRSILTKKLETASAGLNIPLQYITEPINRSTTSNPELKVFLNTIEKLIGKETIGTSASIPPQDKQKIIKDSSDLLRSFFNLSKALDLFTNRVEILTTSKLSNIQRGLEVNLSNISTTASINAGRVQAFSPFGAIEIKGRESLDTKAEELKAQISSIRAQSYGRQLQLPAEFFSKTQQIALRSSNRNIPLGLQLNAYQSRFNQSLENILPNYKSGEYQYDKGEYVYKENNPSEAINNFLKNAKKPEIDKFVSKLIEHRNKLFEVAAIATGEDKGDLEKEIQEIDSATNKYQSSNEGDKQKIKDLRESFKNFRDIINPNEIRKAKESLINSLIVQNVDFIDDVEKYAEQVKSLNEKYNFSDIKNVNFTNIRSKNLEQALIDYQSSLTSFNKGNISGGKYIPSVDTLVGARVDKNGQVTAKDIQDTLNTSFTRNSRDSAQELLEDIRGLRDALHGIRGDAKEAFASFVTGSKTAGDAARQFGLTIATNILDKISRIGFDNLTSFLPGNLNTALGSIFGGGHARGGLIGYAPGGLVGGGSGFRDDVPALLNQGSFVLKRSAVNKYGKGFLDSINYGRGFAGGGVSVNLNNAYEYSGAKQINKDTGLSEFIGKDLKGRFNIDSALSVIGQTDENNPMNAFKFGREQDFLNYLKTKEDYNLARKNFDAQKTGRIVGSLISAASIIGGAYFHAPTNGLFSSSQKSISYGSEGEIYNQNYPAVTPTQYDSNFGYEINRSYPSPSFNGSFSDYYNANPLGIGRRASGGYIDTVPALLTGGEYVMSKTAVDRLGVSYMNRLNSGGVQPGKFASGGLVGNGVNSINPIIQGNNDNNSQMVAAILQLVKINTEIRDIQNGSKTKTNTNIGNNTNTDNNTNNVSSPIVNINISMESNGKTNETTQANGGKNNDRENLQKFGELMKSVAIKTIIENQRDGGLLANSRNR